MKFLIAIVVICMSLALVAGQQFFPARVPRQFNFNPLSGLAQPLPNSIRDPRQNRGPVVFPPSPPDAVDESSGVIVGASGYGFVPPQQSVGQAFYTTAFQVPATSYTAFNYFSSPYSNRFSYF